MTSIVLLLCCVTAASDVFQQSESQPTDERTFLKSVGFPTEGPALLELFQRQTPTPEMEQRIGKLIRELSDAKFTTREQAEKSLQTQGPPVLKPLREALMNADEETRRRGERVLLSIEKNWTEASLESALREVGRQQPPGGVAVLLTYLPFAPSSAVREEAVQCLLAYAKKSGNVEQSLVSALVEKQGDRRGAAAVVVGAHGTPEQRAKVRVLMKDQEANVRFSAAHGLLMGGDREAIPTLLSLLGNGPVDYCYQAEDLLRQIAGEQGATVTLNPEASNRAGVDKAWQNWWREKGAAVDLAKVKLQPPLGLQGAQAQRAAILFLKALARGNNEFRDHLGKGKFFLHFSNIDAFNPPNGEDLRSLLKLPPMVDPAVHIKRAVPPWQLLAMTHPADKSELESLGSGVWAVFFQFPDGAGGFTGRETLFIRLGGSEGGRVVGFSRVFSHRNYWEE